MRVNRKHIKNNTLNSYARGGYNRRDIGSEWNRLAIHKLLQQYSRIGRKNNWRRWELEFFVNNCVSRNKTPRGKPVVSCTQCRLWRRRRRRRSCRRVEMSYAHTHTRTTRVQRFERGVHRGRSTLYYCTYLYYIYLTPEDYTKDLCRASKSLFGQRHRGGSGIGRDHSRRVTPRRRR